MNKRSNKRKLTKKKKNRRSKKHLNKIGGKRIWKGSWFLPSTGKHDEVLKKMTDYATRARSPRRAWPPWPAPSP